ncbi:MAG TPA: response regulator [Gemmataceae bacterium]|nr:response regulator [Gemmataceae bacterium]
MLANRRLPIILLVEDDQRLAQVLCRVLTKSGYEVEWAVNAAAAVRDFQRAPEVALLDLHLPDGDGVELAAVLRARYPDLPMILMTGCPFRLRERPEGAKYFRQVLQKPPELPHLREAISAALKEDPHANHNAAYPR